MAEITISLSGKAGQVLVVNAGGTGLEPATAIDSTVVSGAIPAGGTANQVLKKTDANDYSVEWATGSGGVSQNLAMAFAIAL